MYTKIIVTILFRNVRNNGYYTASSRVYRMIYTSKGMDFQLLIMLPTRRRVQHYYVNTFERYCGMFKLTDTINKINHHPRLAKFER